jgi:hypothetical protein
MVAVFGDKAMNCDFVHHDSLCMPRYAVTELSLENEWLCAPALTKEGGHRPLG